MTVRRLPAALAALVGASTLVTVPGAAAQAQVPTVVIDGRGHGHGVGMSQDGAYWMGRDGATTGAILSHFYPGTTMGRGGGTLRVDVFRSGGPTTVIAFPGGGELRDAPSGPQSAGFPLTVQPGGSVRVSFDGRRYQAVPMDRATAAPVPPTPSPAPATASVTAPAPPPASPTTTAPDLLSALLAPPTTAAPSPAGAQAPAAAPGGNKPSEPVSGRTLWAVPRGDVTVALPEQGRRYRGQMQVVGAGRALQLLNHIDVEQYLRGMGEVMDPSWPPAALRAQAIAARTYAVRSITSGRTLCNTEQCQVYLGETAEYAAMNRAVADTTGQVLRFGGALVETVYSASGGGVSATEVEGFGPGSVDHPYLRAAPYPTRDPRGWSVSMPLADLGRRVGYRGTITDVRVSGAGPSGRAVEITMDGDAGPQVADGYGFQQTLQLKSTLFTIRVERPPAPPEANPSAEVAQVSGGWGHDAQGAVIGPAAAFSPGRSGLGRPPWVALALLLMVTWANAAHRALRRRTVKG